MSRSRGLAATLGLCLAVAVIPALGAEHTFDGVYSGKRVLIKGSDPYCPAEDDVSVIIHGEMLSKASARSSGSTICSGSQVKLC
jgi:hypothetical protein